MLTHLHVTELITHWATYLCTTCISKAQEEFSGTTNLKFASKLKTNTSNNFNSETESLQSTDTDESDDFFAQDVNESDKSDLFDEAERVAKRRGWYVQVKIYNGMNEFFQSTNTPKDFFGDDFDFDEFTDTSLEEEFSDAENNISAECDMDLDEPHHSEDNGIDESSFDNNENSDYEKDDFEEAAEHIENTKTDENLTTHYYLNEIKKIIKDDVKKLYKERPCSSMTKVLQYNVDKWLKERPSKLIHFLESIFGKKFNSKESKFLAAKVIEQLYKLYNRTLVLPLAFLHNLMTYQMSHCQLLLTLNAKSIPSGAATFMNTWLTEAAAVEPKFPDGVVRAVFDNEQRVGKRYRVKAKNNKVPMSVITSHIQLQMHETDTLQYNKVVHPKSWMFQTLTSEHVDRIKKEPQKYNHIIRQTRNKLINDRITVLHKEQTVDENGVSTDAVDVFLAKKEERNDKICQECGEMAEKTQRKCYFCHSHNLEITTPLVYPKPQTKIYPYSHFETTARSNNIGVIVGEPDILNPSSFENITTILQNTGRRSGIEKYTENGQRQWLFLENDGGILLPIFKLIKNMYHCPSCDELIYGEAVYKAHCAAKHGEEPETCNNDREFDWLVPQAGLFHLELNSSKAFMSLMWDVCMKEVTKILGFTSENALKYAKAATDHHKTWDILQAVYIAVTDELLLPYVRHALQNNLSPDVAGYWEFSQCVKNKNYIFMQHAIFTILHSMMLLRTGVRNNNRNFILAARSKLILLFFGRNHPKYQQILAHELLHEELMPSDIKNMKYNNFSLSRTGRAGHYQSGDAAIEEVNKEGKRWIMGVPSAKEWIRSFRNLDNLNRIRTYTLDIAGVTDPKTNSYESKNENSEEVLKIRIFFRESKYLSDPTTAADHMDIGSSTQLSTRLIDFVEIGEANYKESLMRIYEDSEFKMEPVMVTLQEELESKKIENLTMKEIKEKIDELIEKHPEKDVWREMFRKEVKNKPKAKLIEFYYTLIDNDIMNNNPEIPSASAENLTQVESEDNGN